jgi:hypothetical protein
LVEYWDPVDYPPDDHLRPECTLWFHAMNDEEAASLWFHTLSIRSLSDPTHFSLGGPQRQFGSLLGPEVNCRYVCVTGPGGLVRRVR